MTSLTDRIDLQSARLKFNSLRSDHKIQLPDNLKTEIDIIIDRNIEENGKEIEDYDEIVALR